jgi:hypothetical protein
MGTTQEWIDARSERPEWVGTRELRELTLDGSDVGPFAVLVHSGCGDGALICGDGPTLAMYLSRAAVLVHRHTGATLRPPAYRAAVGELVNAAANDVLAWLRGAGIEVDEGSAIASVLDVAVNVVVCRARSHEPVSVEAAIRQSWPDDDVEAVLGWCAS